MVSALSTRCDYDAGQKLVAKEKSYVEYAGLFQTAFETARRYKIMNPEKLRETYGKLVYFLQELHYT